MSRLQTNCSRSYTVQSIFHWMNNARFASRNTLAFVVSAFALVLSAVLIFGTAANAEPLLGIESVDGTYTGTPFSPSDPASENDRGRQEYNLDLNRAGAQVVRVTLMWSDIAYGCSGQTNAQLRNHLNPCYNWARVDDTVDDMRSWMGVDQTGRSRFRQGRQVIFSVRGYPCWLAGEQPCHGRNQPNTACATWSPAKNDNPATPTVDERYLPCPQFPWHGTRVIKNYDKFEAAYLAFQAAAMNRFDGNSTGAAGDVDVYGRTDASGKLLPHVRVSRWTIWNEPNNYYFWDYDQRPERVAPGSKVIPEPATLAAKERCGYAKLVSAASRALPTGHSVAIGPLAPNHDPRGFLAAVLACPEYAGARVDAVAMNPYPTGYRVDCAAANPRGASVVYSPWANFTQLKDGTGCKAFANGSKRYGLQTAELLRRDMDSFAGFAKVKGKKIWFLETGYSAGTAGAETKARQLDQAIKLGQTMDRLTRINGVDYAMWYPMYSDEGDFNLGITDSSSRVRRPSFTAYQAPLSIRYAGWLPASGGKKAGPKYEIYMQYHGNPASGDLKVVPRLGFSDNCDHPDPLPASKYNFKPLKTSPSRGVKVETSASGNIIRATIERVYPTGSGGRLLKSFCIAQLTPKLPGIAANAIVSLQWKGANKEGRSFFVTANPEEPGSGFYLADPVGRVQTIGREIATIEQETLDGEVVPGPDEESTPPEPDPTKGATGARFAATYPGDVEAGSPNADGAPIDDEPANDVTSTDIADETLPEELSPFANFGTDNSTVGESDETSEFGGAFGQMAFGASLMSADAPAPRTSLKVTETTAQEYQHVTQRSVVDDDPQPTDGPAVVRPVLWFNPRYAGDATVVVDDGSNSWSDAFFSAVSSAGWSPATPLTDGGDYPGWTFTSPNGATDPSITYRHGVGAQASGDVTVDIGSIGSWDKSLAFSAEPDSAAPVGPTINYESYANGPVMIKADPGTDSQSGIAKWYVERQEFTFEPAIDEGGRTDAAARCTTAIGSWTAVGSPNPATHEDTSVSGHRCFVYRLSVGNVAVVTGRMVLVDTTAPDTGGFVVGTRDRFLGQTSVLLRFQRGSDTNGDASKRGIGIATRKLWRRSTAFNDNHTCATDQWSAWTVIAANLNQRDSLGTSGWQYRDTGLKDAICYQYHYEQIDFAGNSSDIDGPGSHSGVRFFEPTMKVDLVAPRLSPRITSYLPFGPAYSESPTSLWIGTKTKLGGFAITDAEDAYARSDIREVVAPQIPNASTVWNNTPTSVYQAHYFFGYEWPVGGSLGGNGYYEVTAYSRAEIDRSATVVEYASTTKQIRVRVDNAGPVGGGITASPRINNTRQISLAVTAPSDAMSGMSHMHVEQREAPLIGATEEAPKGVRCGEWSDWRRIHQFLPVRDQTLRGLNLEDTKCYEYKLIAADRVENESTYSSDTVQSDRTVPSVSATTTGAWSSIPNPSISVTATDDASGVARVTVERQESPFNSNGFCNQYGAFTQLSADISGGNQYVKTQFQDRRLLDQRCYRYRFVATDRAGNVSRVELVGILTDFQAPRAEVAITSVDNPTYQRVGANATLVYINTSKGPGSFQVQVRVRESFSRVAEVRFPRIQTRPQTTEGWGDGTVLTDPNDPIWVRAYNHGYRWTTTTPSTELHNAEVVNRAGASTLVPFRTIVDVAGPVGTNISYPTTATSNRVRLNISNGVDTGAGNHNAVLSRASALRVGTTCRPFTDFAPIPRPVNDIDTLQPGRCYMYQYSQTDWVGNETVADPRTVVVTQGVADSTAPVAFAVSARGAALPPITDGSALPACGEQPAVSQPPYHVDWTASSDPESQIDSYDVLLDGVLAATLPANATSAEITPSTALPAGHHTWNVLARNGANLTTPGTHVDAVFTVDYTIPSLSWTSPPAGVAPETVAVTWTANDERCLARVIVKVDGTTHVVTSAASDSTALDLTGGIHSIEVAAYDSAGNVTTQQRLVSVDTSAPNINLSGFTPLTGHAYQHTEGSTLYYNPSEAGQVRFDVVATDDVGVTSVAFPDLDGPSANGWTDGATMTSSGPNVAHVYAWTPGAASLGGGSIVATDYAGHTATTGFSVIADTTPPGSGTIDYPAGIVTTPSMTIDYTTGIDTQSGTDALSHRIERSSASLLAGQCGTFSSYTPTSTTPPSSPYVDTDLATSGCYRYRLSYSDRVGNQRVVSNSNVVRIDRTVPTGTLTTSGNGNVQVAGTAADSESGILSILVRYSGLVSGTICQPSSPTASWSCQWNTTALPEGQYIITVTLTDAHANQAELTQSHIVGVLRTPGARDATYGTDGATDATTTLGLLQVNDAAPMPSGGHVAVAYQQALGQNRAVVARYREDGSLDPGFADGGIGQYTLSGEAVIGSQSPVAITVAVDSQNRSVIGVSAGSSRMVLLRVLPDGTLDPSFDGNGISDSLATSGITPTSHTFGDIAIDAQDRIIATGGQSNPRMVLIARVTTGGAVDTTFNAESSTPGAYVGLPSYNVSSVVVDDQGGILFAGWDGSATGPRTLSRLDPNGSLDTAFGAGGTITVATAAGFRTALATRGSSVWMATSEAGGLTIRKFALNGSPDTAFGVNGRVLALSVQGNHTRAILVDSNGRILATNYTNATTNPGGNIVRLRPDGTLDSTFGNNGVVTRSPREPETFFPIGIFEQESRYVVIGGARLNATAPLRASAVGIFR